MSKKKTKSTPKPVDPKHAKIIRWSVLGMAAVTVLSL
jgi:hypothetical protein